MKNDKLLKYYIMVLMVCISADFCKGLEYQITDLGTCGGTSGQALGINDTGQVVGSYTYQLPNEREVTHGFLWENGQWTDIGASDEDNCEAVAINNIGQVVGTDHYWSGGVYYEYGFIYDKTNGIQNITPSNSQYCQANAVNNQGQVIGSYSDGSEIYEFVYDKNNGYEMIPRLESEYRNYACAINDQGLIVGGGLTTDTTVFNAFSYDSISDHLTNLGVPDGCTDSYAYDINNSGQIIGWAISEITSVFCGFIYDDQTGFTDLGALGYDSSQAFAINDFGQVVGISPSPQTALFEGFLWNDGVMVSLNSLISQGLGWDLRYAYDINNDGWIVGSGLIDGETHAYLLTPVPEPMCLLLLATGGIAIAIKRKNIKRV